MTNDIEGRLADTLRWRADDLVDADRLLGGALRRGRTRQRRLRTAYAFGGAGLAGLAAVALAAGQILAPGDGAGPGPGPGESDRVADQSGGPPTLTPPPPGAHVVPTAEPPVPLPPGGSHQVPVVVRDALGAAARPDLVGTDPLTVHFGFDGLPAPVRAVRWQVARGIETAEISLSVGNADSLWATVSVANSRVPLPEPSTPPSVSTAPFGSIGGRPVTAELVVGDRTVTRAVRWSPIDGVEVRVEGGELSPGDLLRIAEAVRLDRSARCSAPVRLTYLPLAWKTVACTTYLPPDGTDPHMWVAQLTIGSGTGSEISLSVGRRPARRTGPFAGTPTTLPGGVEAGDRSDVPGSPGPAFVIYDLGGRTVNVSGTARVSKSEVREVAAGLRPAGHPDRPDTWPADPYY